MHTLTEWILLDQSRNSLNYKCHSFLFMRPLGVDSKQRDSWEHVYLTDAGVLTGRSCSPPQL